MASLYRHYDRHGNLLYVGISKNAQSRTNQHAAASPWFHLVHNITIKHHDSIVAAHDAEKRAIKTEFPLHNVKHTPRVKGLHYCPILFICAQMLGRIPWSGGTHENKRYISETTFYFAFPERDPDTFPRYDGLIDLGVV